MTRRVVAGLGLALAVAVPSALAWAAPPVSGPPSASRVVVVGIPGLQWDQISRTGTPVLYRLAAASARGALSVRSDTELTCADAGWLTLGAGSRAAGGSPECERRLGVPDWTELVKANTGRLDGRRLGALGVALADAGVCADADPHSALALGPAARTGSDCPVVLRELAPVSDGAAARAVDRQLGPIVDAAGSGTLLLVAGISEAAGTSESHLHVLLASGPGFDAGGELSSPSTSRAPYVQLVDLAPSLLHALGLEVPASMTGRPMTARGGSRAVAADIDRLADLDRRARGQRDVVVPFVVVLVAGLLMLVLAAVWPRRRPERVTSAAALLMALPAASFLAMLVPWWRSGHPLLAVLVVTAAIGAMLAGAAAAGPWRRRPLGVVAVLAAVTGVTIAVDLALGGRLQMDAPLGYSPYVAGRFVGLGNPGFAVYGTAVVLATGLLVRPGQRARWAVGIIALLAVVIDGAPPLGDDLGGVLALVPAFVVLAGLLSGDRLRWPRVALAGVGAGVLVTVFALLDYARGPGHRTHLGRFVEQVRDGTAGQVIHRKAQANLDLLTHSPFTLLVPVLLIAGAWLLLRPPGPLARRLTAHPQARAALLGVLTLSLVGGLVNDSGTAIPAVALLLAVPVGVVVGVSADRARPPA